MSIITLNEVKENFKTYQKGLEHLGLIDINDGIYCDCEQVTNAWDTPVYVESNSMHVERAYNVYKQACVWLI